MVEFMGLGGCFYGFREYINMLLASLLQNSAHVNGFELHGTSIKLEENLLIF